MQSTPRGRPANSHWGEELLLTGGDQELRRAARGSAGDGLGSAARHNFREEPLLRKGNELGRIRIEHRPLGRCIVGLVFGLPIRPVITHQPHKLVSFFEYPRAFNPEAVPLPQRVDAGLPGADEIVHLPSIDGVYSQLYRHGRRSCVYRTMPSTSLTDSAASTSHSATMTGAATQRTGGRSRARAWAWARHSIITWVGIRRIASATPSGSRRRSSTSPRTGMGSGIRSIGLEKYATTQAATSLACHGTWESLYAR